jgi:hypothetical protein
VNQTFARRVLGNRNGVGLYYRVGDLKQPPVQVIGIVEDGKYQGLTEDPRPAIFRPMLQNYSGTTYLLARAAHPQDAHPEAALALQMEQAVQSLDRGMPFTASARSKTCWTSPSSRLAPRRGRSALSACWH